MTGSVPGDLGGLFISVVPSMSGVGNIMGTGAREAADEFARYFHERLGSVMPRMMEETFAAGAVSAGTSAAAAGMLAKSVTAVTAELVTSSAAARVYGKTVSEAMAGAQREVTAVGAAMRANLGGETALLQANMGMWQQYRVHIRDALLELEKYHVGASAARRGSVFGAQASEFDEYSSKYKQAMQLLSAYQAQYGITAEHIEQHRAASAAKRVADQSQEIQGIKSTADAYQVLFQRTAGAREKDSQDAAAHVYKMMDLAETHAQNVRTVKLQGYGKELEDQLAAETEKASKSMLPMMLQKFGGPLAGLAPMFMSHGFKMAQAQLAGFREAMAGAKAAGSLPEEGEIAAAQAAKMSAVGKAAGLAMKATFVGTIAGVAALAIDDAKAIVKLVGLEFEQFAEVGKKAANYLMESFVDMTKGEAPDVMGAFDVIEEGFKALWMAPQNVFNTFIDNTIGRIPLIGSAVKEMVSTVESTFNVIFPLFDEFKELSGVFLGVMVDIGQQWQDVSRLIAGQTLGEEQLHDYLSITEEIANSSLVLHFHDVAQVVGELGQRFAGLPGQVRLSKEELTELAITVAQGNELLGNIHINIDALTAAFNSFGVGAATSTSLLTEFVNISRATGADINAVLRDVEGAGPAFHDMGFGIEETYFLMAKFNQELGSPAMQRFILSMRGMPEMFAKMHIDPEIGFKDLVETVKRDLAAGDLTEALNDSTRFMSRAAASTFVQGVKMGFLGAPEEIIAQVEALKHSADGINQPLEEALEATKGIKDQFEIIGTQALGMFGPMAKDLADSLMHAGNAISDWIKHHQVEIVSYASTVMHDVLKMAVFVIDMAAGAVKTVAPIIQEAVHLVVDGLLAIEMPVRAIIGLLDDLPTAFHLGINTKAALHDLDQFNAALTKVKDAPIAKWGDGVAAAMGGAATAINTQLIPSLDKAAAKAIEMDKFNEATQAKFAKPGEKDAKVQSIFGAIGTTEYTGSESDRKKIAERLQGINVEINSTTQGTTLSGTQENLKVAAEKLSSIPGLAAGPFMQAGSELLGSPAQQEEVKKKLHDEFGITIETDTKTGLITGFKAGTEKAGKDFLEWWQETTGRLSPVPVRLDTPAAPVITGPQPAPSLVVPTPAPPATPGTPPPNPSSNPAITSLEQQRAQLGGLAAGGHIPWLPGSVLGKDSIFAALTPNEHVFTSDEVDKAGGQGAIYRLRAMIRSGRLRGFQGGGDVPGKPVKYFDDGGGVIDNLADPGKSGSPVLWGLARGALGALGIIPPKSGQGEAIGTVPSSYAVPGGYAVPSSATGSGTATFSGAPVTGTPSAMPGGGGQAWLNQQLLAHGLSPDEAKGILAMNVVEGGANNPQSLLGFTESQAHGPQAHVEAFMRQWNDPSRRGPGGGIPGVDGSGRVTDWNAYMTWIRVHIVGQTGVASDWQGNAQPPPGVYQQHLMNALGFAEGGPAGFEASGVIGGVEPKQKFPKEGVPVRYDGGGPVCGLCGGGHPTAFHTGGVVGFDQGGPVTEVIWSDTESGRDVGEANGQWVGTPGSADPGYYHRGKNAFLDHHGHVHTTFTKNPFTGAPYTEVKAGTDIRPGAAGFPDWVYRLGSQYHLQASTYPTHQEWNGINHGIDWWPIGKSDMEGRGYSHEDRVTLTGFAQAAGAVGTGQGQFGGTQFAGLGIPGSSGAVPGSPGGAFGGGPVPNPPGAVGSGGGPGFDSPDPRLAYPPGLGPMPANLQAVPNPYTNVPKNLRIGTPEYTEYKHKWDEYLVGLDKSSRSLADAQARAQRDDDAVGEAKNKEKLAHDAWAKILENQPDLGGKKEEQLMDVPEYQKWKESLKQLATAEETAKASRQTITDKEQEEFLKNEKEPPGVKGDKGDNAGASIGEQAGKGFVEGVAQELGFGTIFKDFLGPGTGLAPWKWGGWKLGTGLLSFGADFLKNKGLLNDLGGAGAPGADVPGGGIPGGPSDVFGPGGAPGPAGGSAPFTVPGNLPGALPGQPEIRPGPAGGTPGLPPAAGSVKPKAWWTGSAWVDSENKPIEAWRLEGKNPEYQVMRDAGGNALPPPRPPAAQGAPSVPLRPPPVVEAPPLPGPSPVPAQGGGFWMSSPGATRQSLGTPDHPGWTWAPELPTAATSGYSQPAQGGQDDGVWSGLAGSGGPGGNVIKQLVNAMPAQLVGMQYKMMRQPDPGMSRGTPPAPANITAGMQAARPRDGEPPGRTGANVTFNTHNDGIMSADAVGKTIGQQVQTASWPGMALAGPVMV